MLTGKKILVGVTGGISAYKTASLVRLLIKAGAEVRVLMSETAKKFVTPLTFATLSKNPVFTEFYNPENGEWHSHVKLALWADLYIVAPATANSIAKMAHGIADNLLLTTCLSARCRIMISPAMDLDMYSNVATQTNIQTLRQRGFLVVEAGEGELASGLSGKGRMAEPEEIFEAACSFLLNTPTSGKENPDAALKGRSIMITAGPTREKIDPVRFITNHSTGKMGYAIAEELASRGASVTLISGPVQIKAKHPNIKVLDVVSAQDMYNACMENFPKCDAAVMSAAVADFTPATKADQKIKKTGDDMTLHLSATKDIAKALGQMKTDRQVFVGFALETQNEMANAQKKLESKNFDFIVLNSLNDKGAGFGHDTNKITIVSRMDGTVDFALKPKTEVASDIADQIVREFSHKNLL
ncbi:MAG: bifunctional phosphopantothenoylcysteine decarboxylase/phosphopantothenate--cysteine ligase CoaBC [Bacteroidales bacterium]|nr:bifunctional phosphopantothenoylcysteine decarboxylase/phosphopantothenate--cysteine ligase CoaBC [Bacteroidales bacterium]